MKKKVLSMLKIKTKFKQNQNLRQETTMDETPRCKTRLYEANRVAYETSKCAWNVKIQSHDHLACEHGETSVVANNAGETSPWDVSWNKKRARTMPKAPSDYALARFKSPGRGGRGGRGRGRGRGGRGRNKRKKKPVQAKGIVHIRSTFNNTLFTVRSLKGRVLGATSAGRCGFKGSRKSTPYAARRAAQTAGRKSLERHLKHVKVYLNGPGAGRETAIRGLMDVGLKITLIRDVTRLPHNGCRPPKKRRV